MEIIILIILTQLPLYYVAARIYGRFSSAKAQAIYAVAASLPAARQSDARSIIEPAAVLVAGAIVDILDGVLSTIAPAAHTRLQKNVNIADRQVAAAMLSDVFTAALVDLVEMAR